VRLRYRYVLFGLLNSHSNTSLYNEFSKPATDAAQIIFGDEK
jgi:hypothetical protein